MGLLQKAVETYESHKSLVGVYQEGKSPLAPIAHTVKKADIEVAITADGKFFGANRDCKDESIIIPVSVDSASRSSQVAPHPLSDKLCYLTPCDQDKYHAYLEGLCAWESSVHSHPKVRAILSYIKGGTMLRNLAASGVIKMTSSGDFAKAKDKELVVRWRVIGLDDGQSENCWQDKTLISAYTQYYLAKQTKNAFCMVYGEEVPVATKHLPGIVSIAARAKLISANDDKDFTYRGRFTQESQSLTVSYDASQKAHNALKWLVDNQGVLVGKRAFLCWNPKGRVIPHATRPLLSREKSIWKPTDYRKQLEDTLNGHLSRLPKNDGVVIASLDAATKGRLAITYYNELKYSDFLERLYTWDCHCCWIFTNTANDDLLETPFLEDIVNCAFGRLTEKKRNLVLETDEKLARQWMQVLLTCRVEKKAIPWEIVSSLIERASSPERYEGSDKCTLWRRKILPTACAVIRKYRFDRFKEEWEMALEPQKLDRSYQFGRMLAIFDKIERATFRRDEREHRTTYTIRYLKAFCKRPLATAASISEHLEEAYLPRLSPASQEFYKGLLGEVMEVISRTSESALNDKLSETYLLGYYLQRNDLKKKEHKEEEE